MKRVLALILTVLLIGALSPASLLAQAETVRKKGFYMVNWDELADVDSYTYDNVYHMPFTWLNTKNLDQNPLPVLFKCYNTTNIKTIAKRMYDDFSKRPEGTRIFNYAAMATILKQTVVDVVDMEKGVAMSREWLDSLLTEYKALGGELDGIAIDLEYNKCFYYYIESEQYSKGNTDIYNQIVRNPVYQEKIRPELEKQGFIFYQNPDPAKYPERSEIWTIYRYDKDGGIGSCRSIWGQTMHGLMADYINRAALEPMLKHYPNAFMSDYKTGDINTWYKPLDSDGSQFGYNYVKAGNTSNYNAYQWQPSASMFGYSNSSKRADRNKYTKPAGYNDAVYPDTPYGQFLFETNLQKRMLLSTDNGRVNTWLTFFNYGTSKPHSYSNTAYYAEQIFHSGLITSETFFGYVIAKEVVNKGVNFADANIGDYGYNLKVIDDALAELTRVAGASDRKPIVLPMDWNGYTLSGMYAGGRNIWRITPDIGKVSLENFKVKDTAPTFCVDGVTITFPQGRIISDGNVRQVGTCGYWVETPANVTPVVTAADDRFRENPAFADTFDTYKPGVFTSASVLPNTYWAVTGNVSVVDNGGDKALSMTGGSVLTSTKVPEKITAGDYYAKQQGWEITVTLPAGNYGEVRLLNTDVDQGFKVSGGKVYYDAIGGYKEMEGVNLPAGTYTFKREMDFREGMNFVCNYVVCDAAGNLVAKAENVDIRICALPIAKVSMYTENTVDPVLVDDYKMYPMGVTASLDLYGVEYGRKIANTNGAQTKDTAYRLSWLNATDKYQIARIYDAKTGTILKKVEMAPGMNGAVAGVVEIGDGQAVEFAVHVQEGADRNHPDYDSGNFAWTAEAEKLGLAAGTKGATGADYVPLADDGVGKEGDNIAPILEADKKAEDEANNAAGENNDSADGNNNTDGNTSKKGLSGGIIALLVVAGLAIAAGAVYLFVIKPKRIARFSKDTTEE